MLMLRTIRKQQGLTMKQLGDSIGVAESTVSMYETGKRNPDYETLLKLSEVLNCSVDSILGNNFALTNEEEMMLYLFRQFKPGRRFVAIQLLSSLLETEKNSADTDSVSA